MQPKCDRCTRLARYRYVAINRMELRKGERVAYLFCHYHALRQHDKRYKITPLPRRRV